MELNCIQWRRDTCVALEEHKAAVAIPDNRCHRRNVFSHAYLCTTRKQIVLKIDVASLEHPCHRRFEGFGEILKTQEMALI